MDKEYAFIYLVMVVSLTGVAALEIQEKNKHNRATAALIESDYSHRERDRIYVIDRGAEDDAAELALSEHQEVNYVRCFLRPAGYVTCQVHTPPMDVEAQCRARGPRDFLVDGTRCRWTNPVSMAHP